MNLTQTCVQWRLVFGFERYCTFRVYYERKLLLSMTIPARFLPVFREKAVVYSAVFLRPYHDRGALGSLFGSRNSLTPLSLIPLKASNVAFETRRTRKLSVFFVFFIRIKVHKSLGVDISLIDKQVTCRRGYSTFKEWTSALLQSGTDFWSVFRIRNATLLGKILFYIKCITDEQHFTAHYYKMHRHKLWRLCVRYRFKCSNI
jgi:hypothetical protein